MLTIAINEQAMAQLQQVAAEQGDTPQDIVETLVEKFLRETARRKMKREVAAFVALHPTLLEQYPGHYVAICKGQLVDHDVDQLNLYQRIEQKYPREVVLIRQVQPEVETTYTFRSPKFV